MARAVITPVVIPAYNGSAAFAFTALDGTDGAEIAWSGRDIDATILVQNTDTVNDEVLTIKKGNAEQGVVDFTYTIVKNTMRAICIESAFFKNVTGTDKGKIVLTGSADLKVAVVLHP